VCAVLASVARLPCLLLGWSTRLCAMQTVHARKFAASVVLVLLEKGVLNSRVIEERCCMLQHASFGVAPLLTHALGP